MRVFLSSRMFVLPVNRRQHCRYYYYYYYYIS